MTLTPLRRGFFTCFYYLLVTKTVVSPTGFASGYPATLATANLCTVAATVGVATVAPVLVNSVNWTTLVPTVVAGHVLRKSLSKGL